MLFDFILFTDPDDFARERLCISDNSSLKNPLTDCQLKTYEYNMMAECVFNECNNLLLNFAEGKYSNKPCKVRLMSTCISFVVSY